MAITTIYRTYAPSGDIDHARPIEVIELLHEYGELVTQVVELEYKGDVTWNDEETLATGKLEWATDKTEHWAGLLMASWCGEDSMIDENPHELVYMHFNVDQMRKERLDEIAEMRNRPSCGGM